MGVHHITFLNYAMELKKFKETSISYKVRYRTSTFLERWLKEKSKPYILNEVQY